MTIALLTIGTELTRGELENTNSTWMAAELSERGYEVTTMVTVDDDDDRIISQLKALSLDHGAIFCTGGLGPTTDDRTAACAAAALGVPLERNHEVLAHVRGLFQARGISMSVSNEKQADFPAGSVILPNHSGTAAGFSVTFGDCQAFFMPGVPSEMRTMFLDHALPMIPLPSRPVVTARLQTFGLPEAEVNDRLRGIEEEHGIVLGYRASRSQIEVKVLAEARDDENHDETLARAERIVDLIGERLGPVAFGRGRTTLAREVGQELLESGQSLALAESCTGGLVSEWITSVPGASAYYRGGVCSYSNRVKELALGVPPQLLETHGAVSEEVARAMAQGARDRLESDVALSLTGIAGPGGGSKDKPVGLVHWAIATPRTTHTYRRVFSGSREIIQRRAGLSGLSSLLHVLRGTAG